MVVLLYAVFLLSGAAGLVYESIWARYLGIFVGHGAFAQTIVLVIFMSGMAVGALTVGERTSRLRSPLLWYAVVELAAGIIGLVFHGSFVALTSVAYEHVFPALGAGPAELSIKWLMAALLILPQSVLLGATFPLMSAGVIRLAPQHGGRSLALLYFTNSLGAAVGALVSGFYLVGRVGLPGTLVVAATLNVVVAIVAIVAAIVAAGREPSPSPIPAAPIEPVATGNERSTPLTRLLLGVAFGTAVASFIYEITWVRMLSLVLGSATHSFELMLSAFILGLALGAYWIRNRVDIGSLRLLAIIQLSMGTLAIATLPVYLASFNWMAKAMTVFSRTNEGYLGMNIFDYGLCLAVMLPATFCAGMTLPIITRLLSGAGEGERAIGAVYGVNTLGSIVGVVLASLVFMPLLGLKWLLVLGGCVDIGLGAWLIVVDRRARPWRASRWMLAGAAVASIALIAVIFRAKLDRGVLTSGVFRYAAVPVPGARNVLFYRDGRTSTVSVRRSESTGALSLATNGKPDASLGPEWMRPMRPDRPRQPFSNDAGTQTLLAVIPLAYVPGARSAAVIGQGSGMSSHLLLGSPVLERLVTVEIEPEMIRGSLQFYPANRRVFDDERSTFVIDDARSYFASKQERYDVIMAEPSNPWVAGVAGLFTEEFYRHLKRHVADGGVLAQWLHTYDLDDALVMSVIAALGRHFPSYALFSIGNNDLLIVASTRASLPQPDWTVVQRFPGIAEDLARVTPLTPHTFETLRLGDDRSLAPLARRTTPNSDFYPVLELNAERARFTRREAIGIASLGAERFSVSLTLAGVRNGFGDETEQALPYVPRLAAAVRTASLRRPTVPLRKPAEPVAAFRHQVLRQSLRTGAAPVDWKAWVQTMSAMENDLHGGTAGIADTTFYADVKQFLLRTSPPSEAIASMTFLHGLAVWDFPAASRAAEPLIAAARRGDIWLDADLLRDGATTARLMIGDARGAREAFAGLALQSRRSPSDLRTLMIESLLDAANNPSAIPRVSQ